MSTRAKLLELVTEEIRSAGMSQSEIAYHLGISQSYISQILSGNRQLSYERADAVLSACGVRLELTLVNLMDKEEGER